MVALTESRHTGEFILSEAQGARSRENVTVLSGQNLKAGHVVGRVALGSATPAANAGNTGGSGTIGAVTVGLGAKVGVYQLVCIEPATNAGKFTVEDPDGVQVGVATVGVAFSGGGLGFTISDATDFVSGDGFTITVAAGSNKVKEYNPANTDGSAVPWGILLAPVDASATGTNADTPGVAIVRAAEVNQNALTWFSGASSPQKAAALAALASPAQLIAR